MRHAIKILALLALALLPALALADGPVLLVELPEEAQMVENVEFDDGDFIQTYQLSGNATVHLLRYGSFDMTPDELAQSEWTGCTDVRAMSVQEIGGFPASGIRLNYQEDDDEGGHELDVSIILVDTGADTLMFEAVFPKTLGDAQIEATVQRMIQSMDVLSGDPADEDVEVG